MNDEKTTADPTRPNGPSPWDDIADELELVIPDLRALAGEPAPAQFQLNIQPHDADRLRAATAKNRAATVAAVDAVANLLLGKDAETYKVSGGFHHGVHAERGPLLLSIYQAVADPDAVDPEQELERLREENARLRAAAGLDHSRDEPFDAHGGRVPPHLEDGRRPGEAIAEHPGEALDASACGAPSDAGTACVLDAGHDDHHTDKAGWMWG